MVAYPVDRCTRCYYQANTTHSSLDKFNVKFHARIGETIIHTNDLKEEDQTLFLPVYMAELL